ncbi:MAG: conserved repeat protein [Caulobacteraceae bacterium]|nr:conserved repeat protein [Caulobacteraceae bacterium]
MKGYLAMKRQLGGLIAAAAIVSAGSASATTIILDGGGSNTPGGTTIEGLNVGNTRTYTSGPVTVTAQGWTYDTSYNPDQLLSSYLGAYSGGGLGVSSPHVDANGQCWFGCSGDGNGGSEEGFSGNQHAVDNNDDGRIDFVLLKFNTAVDLTSVFFNVYDVNPGGSADGDATAYYKGGAFAPASGGDATAYLNQFTSIGLPGSSSGSRNVSGLTFSDTWLIGAAANSDGNDGFKLFSVSFDAAAVPEPATWLSMIMGFGLIGVMMRRRRQMAAIAA